MARSGWIYGKDLWQRSTAKSFCPADDNLTHSVQEHEHRWQHTNSTPEPSTSSKDWPVSSLLDDTPEDFNIDALDTDFDAKQRVSQVQVSANGSQILDQEGRVENKVLKKVTVRWMSGESEVFEGEWKTVLQIKMQLIERCVDEARFLSDIAVFDPTNYEILSDDSQVLPVITVVFKELKTRKNLQEWKENIELHYLAEGVQGLIRIGEQMERDKCINVADVFERQRGFRVFIAVQNKDPNLLCELVGYESHINLLAIYTLIAAKGDPNADIGGSVLLHAIHEGNLPVVNFLIEHKADVTAPGSHWCSESTLPLHTATNLAAFSSGDVNIIRSLLDAKASVNARNSNGKTVVQHFLEHSQWFLCCKKTNRRPTQVAEVLQQALEDGDQAENSKGDDHNFTKEIDALNSPPPASPIFQYERRTTSARSSLYLSDRDDLWKPYDYSSRSSACGRPSRATSRRTSLHGVDVSEPRGCLNDDILNRLHLLDDAQSSVEYGQDPSLVDPELLARLQELHRLVGERDSEIYDASRRSSIERTSGACSSHTDSERQGLRRMLQLTVVENGLGFPLASEGRCTLERARNEVAMVLQQALETSANVLEEALEKTKG